jgi:DNA damage-binding protein 1
MEGIKGMWSLRGGWTEAFDQYLVVAFRNETHVLGIEGETMGEVDIPGFDDTVQTLCCTNTMYNAWVQVTHVSVRLVDCATLDLVHEWKPDGATITVAATNPSQVLVALGGGNLVLLDILEKELIVSSRTTLDHEVACLDISPLGSQHGGEDNKATFAAVGMWMDMSMRVLNLPSLEESNRHVLSASSSSSEGGGDVISRSVMFHVFGLNPHLLVGLGDGRLLNFRFDPKGGTDSLMNLKRVTLGTQPIGLKRFRARDKEYVFAASDRPTVVYCNNGKVLYSNVNRGEVTTVSSFNTADFPDSIALASDDSMSIGSIDEIQKLHIRDEPIGESPVRIAHDQSSGTFIVSTTQVVDEGPDQNEKYQLRVLDSSTFELVDTFALDDYEMGISLTSCTFEGSDETFYVVGTAVVLEDEQEPTRGRVLVLSVTGGVGDDDGDAEMGGTSDVTGRRCVLVSQVETRGAVYCLEPFQGMLLAGVNSKTQLYRWSPAASSSSSSTSSSSYSSSSYCSSSSSSSSSGAITSELKSVCGHHGHILALYIKSHGDFIIVGDLMKSISLLVYKPLENSIDEIARDYNAIWLTSVAIFDDDTYFGDDISFNLFTVSFFSLPLFF